MSQCSHLPRSGTHWLCDLDKSMNEQEHLLHRVAGRLKYEVLSSGPIGIISYQAHFTDKKTEFQRG